MVRHDFKPNLDRPIVDPFNSHTTLNIFCDILDAVKKDPYERDPRGTAKKVEAYLKNLALEINLILDQSQNFLFLMMFGLRMT